MSSPSIRVSCGHEKGIGLEVFLKAFCQLERKKQRYFNLHIPSPVWDKYPCSFKNVDLPITFIETSQNPSIDSLNSALKDISEHDILLTLPTSKNQLFWKGSLTAGYTEYLRQRFNLSHLSMSFKSPIENILLLSDHIPLKEVTKFLNPELILQKTKNVLSRKFFKKVVFSGINPHAGESGVLGTEESCYQPAILELTKLFPQTQFEGPIPGDTLYFSPYDSNVLLVYAFHDQGLAPFKRQSRTLGVNLTYGLPFLRASVDHGTAFSLYGKNQANAQGCYFVLQELIKEISNA